MMKWKWPKTSKAATSMRASEPSKTSKCGKIMIYSEKFSKNVFSRVEQKRIRESVFAIIGLGGTGGFALENLVRMGAERFILIDSDRFELTNFNRQILATVANMDKPKAEAALARAKEINPDVQAKILDMRFEKETDLTETCLADASIVIDGTDNPESRLAIANAARKKNIPCVFCSAGGVRGLVSIFVKYKYERAFRLAAGVPGRSSSEIPDTKHKTQNQPDDQPLPFVCSRVICPAAALSGTLAASQAVNCILKRPFVKAPQALFFDLDREDMFWKAKLG